MGNTTVKQPLVNQTQVTEPEPAYKEPIFHEDGSVTCSCGREYVNEI